MIEGSGDRERFLEDVQSSFGLTPRQSETAFLVRGGFTNAEIAIQLRVSLSTVKSHLHAIFVCLEVRSRVELVAKLDNILGVAACPPDNVFPMPSRPDSNPTSSSE